MPPPLALDAAIFGGGAAGLWLLDEMVRRGYRVVLLDAGDLGSGQTVASQGIIHGGLKYSLSGMLTSSARSVRQMPMLWRRCLAGEIEPRLTGTRLRSDFCYLWHTQSIGSRLSMVGARIGLAVAPIALDPEERPAVLAGIDGDVARLNEQVIEPSTFIADLADRHRGRLLRIDAENGLEFQTDGAGVITLVRLLNPDTGEPLDLRPSEVVFTAGAGNEMLRRRAGLPAPLMQRRPLHMVMARGDLPWLNGHCVDGRSTRVTITSSQDCRDAVVWQVGGQIAERGVEDDPGTLIDRAHAELADVLPGLDLDGTEFATYRVDRAEQRTASGRRPDLPSITRDGNTTTAWPTKLVLVPQMVEQLIDVLEVGPTPDEAGGEPTLPPWPCPQPALPPWEKEARWSLAH